MSNNRVIAENKKLTLAEITTILAEVRELLDDGASLAAEEKLRPLISNGGLTTETTAQARLAKSKILEMQGKFQGALAAIEMYEKVPSRLMLQEETSVSLQVQIALCYNYLSNSHKSVTLLKTALQDAEADGSDKLLGMVYTALSRVYRSLTEFAISNDFALQGLDHYRNAGSWKGMAQAYLSLANTAGQEGKYEEYVEHCQQILKIIGDRPATFLLGRVYSDMAGAFYFLRRPHEGIVYLEKSISFFEKTEHKTNAASAYNNLGANLILIGDWNKAQCAFQRANEIFADSNHPAVSMTLDSLGEIALLRGDVSTAQTLLEKAVAIAEERKKTWFLVQAQRTLCRLYTSLEDFEKALDLAEANQELAEKLGDKHSIGHAHLLFAEICLKLKRWDNFEAEINQITDSLDEDSSDLVLTGKAYRLQGEAALEKGEMTFAIQHLSRAVSIFEILNDVYRKAVCQTYLGRALAKNQHQRAVENLESAIKIFRQLETRPMLELAESFLNNLDNQPAVKTSQSSALTQLLTLRLTEAVASRKLLLQEFAAILSQETSLQKVLVFEPGENGRWQLVTNYGCSMPESAELTDKFNQTETGKFEQIAKKHNFLLINLRSPNAKPAFVLLNPPEFSLPDGFSLKPLTRVVEIGLDLCALRERDKTFRHIQEAHPLSDQSILPGFIHSSPAMAALVEEVYKIRSSDVTVLVTGESGTGKEVVSRAIHAVSSRKDKIFIPFNCTAVPKELTDAYLFGHKKGAFTGAINDSQGVIRAASGGTLFLDEIGDLPLDVQPKLLRFLQEGEVQPLGEHKPVKVDVRIIAATNMPLEDMVEQGRFREDLYYRLNIIRLRVPPLNERRSEIPPMVKYYLNHYSEKFHRQNLTITPQTIDLLMVCNWKGNVRQLCNEIQRIVARAQDGEVITPEHLSPELKRVSMPIAAPEGAESSINSSLSLAFKSTEPETAKEIQETDFSGLTLDAAVSELEKKMILDALSRNQNNISRTARELGLTRRGLYLKLERYKLSA